MAEKLRIGVGVKHGVDVNLARADGTSGLVNLASAPRKTSDFDRNAVEEAVRVREKHGGTVTAITVGGPAAREALRDALAIGADEAVLVTADGWAEWDTRAVSLLLSASIRHLGGFDLFLVGEGSTDHFAGLMGPRIAAQLAVGDVAHVRKLTVEAGGVVLEKDFEKEIETVRAHFPVILTVGQEINTPRQPSFMANLKASKKEPKVLRPADIGVDPSALTPSVIIERVSVPDVPRKRVAIAGTSPDELATRLKEALKGEGVVA